MTVFQVSQLLIFQSFTAAEVSPRQLEFNRSLPQAFVKLVCESQASVEVRGAQLWSRKSSCGFVSSLQCSKNMSSLSVGPCAKHA